MQYPRVEASVQTRHGTDPGSARPRQSLPLTTKRLRAPPSRGTMSGAMRAAVLWLAAAVVVAVSSCGGGSAKPDGGGGGGGGSDGGGSDISLPPGDAGGITDAGAADLPRSTGDFPYTGRWWAILTEPPADGGVADPHPFVIHWSDTDAA